MFSARCSWRARIIPPCPCHVSIQLRTWPAVPAAFVFVINILRKSGRTPCFQPSAPIGFASVPKKTSKILLTTAPTGLTRTHSFIRQSRMAYKGSAVRAFSLSAPRLQGVPQSWSWKFDRAAIFGIQLWLSWSNRKYCRAHNTLLRWKSPLGL